MQICAPSLGGPTHSRRYYLSSAHVIHNTCIPSRFLASACFLPSPDSRPHIVITSLLSICCNRNALSVYELQSFLNYLLPYFSMTWLWKLSCSYCPSCTCFIFCLCIVSPWQFVIFKELLVFLSIIFN